jgi:hypothetical protein
VNAGNSDHSVAWLNDLLEAFAVEAELAGFVGGGLKQSDPFVADLAPDAPLDMIFPRGIILVSPDYFRTPRADTLLGPLLGRVLRPAIFKDRQRFGF